MGGHDNEGKEQDSLLLLHPYKGVQQNICVMGCDEKMFPIYNGCRDEIEMGQVMERGKGHIFLACPFLLGGYPPPRTAAGATTLFSNSRDLPKAV